MNLAMIVARKSLLPPPPSLPFCAIEIHRWQDDMRSVFIKSHYLPVQMAVLSFFCLHEKVENKGYR